MRQLKADRFNVTPYDIAWTIRDSWLGNIHSGLDPVLREVIPLYEMEAARVLRSEALVSRNDEPKRIDNVETWRLWWMNEAHHLSTHDGYTPDADYSLEGNIRHAVNVLNAASELRSAMESKDVERTALFSILLAMEALQGGYSIELESAKEALDKREQDGIGKINAKYKRLENACVKLAKTIWEDDGTKRIGDVVQTILDRIFKAKTKQDIPIPSDETINGWLINAANVGKLTMPAGARKGGRPKKK